MKKILLLILLIQLGVVYAINIDGFHQIYGNNDLCFFSEDSRDYSVYMKYVVKKNKHLEQIFNRKLNKIIKIYIYKDHKSVSEKVFNSDEQSPYSGFSDIVNGIIYVTSPYDSYKSIEDYFNTPVHELVHQYYSSSQVWIREGLAHYLSDLYKSVPINKLPESINDFRFYAYTNEDTKYAYCMSGWMIKYIYEEICNKNMDLFFACVKNPMNYQTMKINSEKKLFEKYQKYMVLKRIEKIVNDKLYENGLINHGNLLCEES